MTDTLTPPPTPSPSPPPPSRTRASSTVIAILTIALGAAILLGALVAASFRAVGSAMLEDASHTADAVGVRDLDLDITAADLRVEFADVTQARLDVSQGAAADQWRLVRDGDRLSVSTPSEFFGLRWMFGGNGDAVLVLPERLERAGMDATLDLAAGRIIADADWGDVALSISAGEVDLAGSADTIAADVSAGSADIDVTDVTDARFDVSAGEIVARMGGEAPDEVQVAVSAGSLRVVVPDEVYAVDIDVSAGDVTNRLQTSPSSPHRITGDVSAGDVRLTPAD
ncbi:hypothetical protein RZO50_05775 [Microbacterium sp. SSW1-59]|uniref:hypothetical protein n=1 Tax=Microbacterium xanthum TaxID=3079794 RepID=UPI002AD2316D|nr:hypothetical protein [Microbacterium sp. SSW1-59]MDZ8201011.1 hypothetical protein [Microbacterium sp. SSW1-59]